jgi:hypothetical protein
VGRGKKRMHMDLRMNAERERDSKRIFTCKENAEVGGKKSLKNGLL